MFEKIFSFVIGVLGIVTTTIPSPIQPATINKLNGKSDTEINKIADFTQVKSPVSTSKSIATATPTVASTTKNKAGKANVAKKTPPTPVVAPKSAEAPRHLPTSVTSSKPVPRPSSETPSGLLGISSSTSTTSSSTASTYQLTNSQTNPLAPTDWNAINLKARQSIVNIFCTSQSGGLFEPLSGSGVIIDPRGIILTNAHVGQYFLVKDYRVKNFLNCVARTGSPAKPAYTLKLLYISPDWVKDNYKKITAVHPTGTGENDFALLEITGSVNPDTQLKKNNFPFMTTNINGDAIKTGNSVVLVGYPAGFLGGITIQRELYMVSSTVNLGQLFTFKNGTIDAFSLGGSPVAQQGASGGAVVDSEGKLLGIIVTSTDAKKTSDRNLDAISITHIDRGFAAETGVTLNSLLATQNIENFSTQFDLEVLPILEKLFLDELDSKNQ